MSDQIAQVSYPVKFIDKRILNLSYSALLALHSCPRKFQLERLNAEILQEEDIDSSITLSFGTIVGMGIQLSLEGKSEEEIMWQMFLNWKPDFAAVNEKQKKSFSYAVSAVQSFISLCAQGLLDDWELCYIDDKPACELGFRIHLPNNYKYRGFVDAVLRNKVTGAIMVLEAKTTSATNVNSATYKNSFQAVGYSIVLDKLFPSLSSYEVLYLVYCTKSFTWETMPFTKTFLQRALWLQELYLETQRLQLYESAGVYPMHGESCFDFYRECNYLSTCTLSTKYLTKNLTPEQEQELDKKENDGKYQVEVTFEDLVRVQLEKE